MVQADAAALVQQKEAAESAAKAQRASADAAALQAWGDSAAAKAKMSMAEVLRKLSEVSIHPLMLPETSAHLTRLCWQPRPRCSWLNLSGRFLR